MPPPPRGSQEVCEPRLAYDDQSETRGGTVILDGVHRYHFCTARPYYDCILPVFRGGWGVRVCADLAAAWASSQRGGICSTPTPVGAASAVEEWP